MFLKINHLFVYFLAWNFFHGKNFLHPKTERGERKKRKGEGSNKRSTWGGESRVSSVYREPWNMMFLQSMVAFPSHFGCTHTKHNISEIMFTHRYGWGRFFFATYCRCQCACLCANIPYTCSFCSAGDISGSAEQHFSSQLPFSLRLSYSSILRFFRLLIYYVPKKNCYRWSIFKFFFGLAI